MGSDGNILGVNEDDLTVARVETSLFNAVSLVTIIVLTIKNDKNQVT